MKRVVFDLDDTISIHTDRDYENAKPVAPVIQRMRELRAAMPSVEIVIFTARGQASCNGDSALAEERNRPTIERWLARHGVPYDRIVFGKPLGDAYIDDKAVSVEEFIAHGARPLSGGFSGASVSRVGNIVVKRCGDARDLIDWYRCANSLPMRSVRFPRLISGQLGKLYLRWVDGTPLAQLGDGSLLESGWIERVADAVREFAGFHEEGWNDVEAYCRYLEGRCAEVGVEPSVVMEPLRGVAPMLMRKTFCHGDFSTMNLIAARGGQLWAIDAHAESHIRSYLTDAAKFLACLRGLQDALTDDASGDRYNVAEVFLSRFTEREREAIEAMRRSMVLRVAPYAKKAGREETLCKVLRLIG